MLGFFVFVDIRSETHNLDEMALEGAMTEKTESIVPVHYADWSEEEQVNVIIEIFSFFGR
ncbi:DegT/DnrJ/EryC1/StrS family aminotransferase [Sneathiella litorea]|uniref:Uncharacterized protein n=1 Tax=Sneathiella litorea TaxID=2606216 RepID=A0A6L8W8E9_9PROT|nr:hypothetical protein [Sneathiella litorea]